MTGSTKDPIHLGPITVTFTVDAADSGGSLTVARNDVKGGAGAPDPHRHDGFDQTVYGIEGVVTFTIDGREVPIGPGETVCIRRGVVHSFMADHGDASFLSIHTPGVFGPEFFYDVLAIAPPDTGPPDQEAINEVMLRHGLTPVAPP